MEKIVSQRYAPTGVLRAALNFGNRVLVGRNAAGKPFGISVDLADALATAIGCDLTFVEFERAIDVSSSAEEGRWDVCFLAIDPDRARTIAFTAPYVRISGCYLVGAAVEIADGSAVATSELRIGVVEGSAYTLHLSRGAGAENLVKKPNICAALAAFDAGEVKGVAGIEEAMAQEALRRPGSRVLQPPFMQIEQAMGMPIGRDAALAHLRPYLAELARTGIVGEILERHGLSRDCAVVPAPAWEAG